MQRVSLSDTGDWQLVNDGQDIRGYNVVDGNGQPLGTVASMLLDTDKEQVTTLVLEDGTEVAVKDVTIGENVVYMDGAGASSGAMAETTAGDMTGAAAGTATGGSVREGVTVFDDSGHIVRRESVTAGDFDAHGDDFEAHHATTYAAGGRAYGDDAEAYRYGFESAHGDTYRNRSFGDAETDLTSGYTPGRDFGNDREAVRYGYSRAQRRS